MPNEIKSVILRLTDSLKIANTEYETVYTSDDETVDKVFVDVTRLVSVARYLHAKDEAEKESVVITYASSGVQLTLFDCTFCEINKYILIDSRFLAEIPCRCDDLRKENVDTASQLTAAMASLQIQSFVDRIRKIFTINICGANNEDDEDTVCSAMRVLLEALELVSVNAVYLIQLIYN